MKKRLIRYLGDSSLRSRMTIIVLVLLMSLTSVKIANVAEQELQKFKTDNVDERYAAYALFMKHACNVDLFPTQLMQADDYFHNTYTLEVKPPRAAKSFGKNGINLYECAINEKENLTIYTPKFSIGKEAYDYQYNFISNSTLLNNFIRVKSGKNQLSSIRYEFVNQSNCKIMTVAGKMEGHETSIADVMELDLWDWEDFANKMPRRLGSINQNGLPTRIRVDGTIMGQENIYKLVTEEKYLNIYRNLMRAQPNNLLGIPEGTLMDVDIMLAAGVLDPDMVELQKQQMTPDEVQRSLYLKFTESTNFIHSKYLLAVMKKAQKWNLEGVPFIKDGRYVSDGIVSIGFDCGHAGQTETSSKYSLQVYEHFGNYRRWLNSFTWASDYDDSQLLKEIVEIIAFYRPLGGYGDALKQNFISSLNDICWREGLTDLNREEFPDNKPSSWDHWFITPLWNTDKNKHFYYDSLQQGIHKGTCYYPYYSISDNRHEAAQMRQLKRQMLNIRKEKTKGSYPRYKANDEKIGDDHTDAAGMANLWLDVHVQKPIDYSLIKPSGMQTKTAGLTDNSILSDLNISRENYDNF